MRVGDLIDRRSYVLIGPEQYLWKTVKIKCIFNRDIYTFPRIPEILNPLLTLKDETCMFDLPGKRTRGGLKNLTSSLPSSCECVTNIKHSTLIIFDDVKIGDVIKGYKIEWAKYPLKYGKVMYVSDDGEFNAYIRIKCILYENISIQEFAKLWWIKLKQPCNECMKLSKEFPHTTNARCIECLLIE